MKRRANHRVPENYFADAPTLSAESENLGRSVPSHTGAAGREAAGESDSAVNSAASMIAAGGNTASGGEGLSPLANPGRAAR